MTGCDRAKATRKHVHGMVIRHARPKVIKKHPVARYARRTASRRGAGVRFDLATGQLSATVGLAHIIPGEGYRMGKSSPPAFFVAPKRGKSLWQAQPYATIEYGESRAGLSDRVPALPGGGESKGDACPRDTTQPCLRFRPVGTFSHRRETKRAGSWPLASREKVSP